MSKAVTDGLELFRGDGATTNPKSAINPPLLNFQWKGPASQRYAKLSKEQKLNQLIARCRKAERKLDKLMTEGR